MSEQTQALSVQAQFTEGTELYSTIKDDGTRASKIKIYNTLQNPDKALGDIIGQEIEVVHMMAHPVKLVAEETGELQDHMRVILVDSSNISYATVSGGITSALKQIFSIVGEPPFFDEPLKLKVIQKRGKGNNKFLTLELI